MTKEETDRLTKFIELLIKINNKRNIIPIPTSDKSTPKNKTISSPQSDTSHPARKVV